jgi:hypothetical protein
MYIAVSQDLTNPYPFMLTLISEDPPSTWERIKSAIGGILERDLPNLVCGPGTAAAQASSNPYYKAYGAYASWTCGRFTLPVPMEPLPPPDLTPPPAPAVTVPDVPAPSTVAVQRYAGCVSRFHKTKKTFSVYCPVGWRPPIEPSALSVQTPPASTVLGPEAQLLIHRALQPATAAPTLGPEAQLLMHRATASRLPTAPAAGFGAVDFFGQAATPAVTPAPPTGVFKVADLPVAPPETPMIGTEDDPFYKKPLFWAAVAGGVLVVGGGGYALYRRKRAA